MINCSAIIDWKHGDIVWYGDHVVFKYGSSGNAYFHEFNLCTPSVFENIEEASFDD